jgi:hypothetical protein
VTPPPLWWLAGGVIAAVAFALRVLVHLGRVPGGVDTWYYLAYADAFRKRPGLDVRLPQYLLQDERQSYPPLFPSLLALLPRSWLLRWFWAVSPAIDCLHLLLLYWVAFKITASLPVSALAAATYAFTPLLVSESRSLSARTLGALLHSVAVILALKTIVSGGSWPSLALALLAGAALFLTSAAMSAAYGFVCLALSVVFQDARYLLLALGALALAILLSGGHFLRVVRNYFHAVEYWRRNRRRYGAHPVLHSPIYGDPGAHPVAQRPGFLGGNTAQQLLRLLGENPFLLALPLAPFGIVPWGPRLYLWAIALVFLSLVATLLPPLRAFGPGRSYMRAAVFPTAYTLAFGIGTPRGFARPVGVVTLVCLSLSVAAIVFFYLYARSRATEQTASAPRGLIDGVRSLAGRPAGGLFCMPFVYADYACYHSGRPVLWGGHCGDLKRLQALAPVLSRPLPELMREHGVRYVLLDTHFVRPEEIGLAGRLDCLGRFESFTLYEARAAVAQTAEETPAAAARARAPGAAGPDRAAS